ncbi:MAG: adenylyl-sulfate kinase [Halobacteria archaeon]|nr:adenylyl-sulfate kinase [Halobacteria archaeon]
MSYTLWFMGLPASGKSTLAKRVEERLRQMDIQVENLDGDEIRKNIHPDLGFTREEREINNRRTAFICKLLNRNGISVVTGMITPFRDSQEKVREIIEPEGKFVMIYVKCSVEECARRDPKGLYEKAKAGKIENFTGVSHPFQEPLNPDIIVDTEEQEPDESVEHIMKKLHELGIFDEEAEGDYNFEITREEEEKVKKRLKEQGYID